MKTKKYLCCDDCRPIIVNGDATHLDNYPEPQASVQVAEISLGINRIQETDKVTLCGEIPELYNEFSNAQCDICLTRLPGARHTITGVTK